MNFLYPSIAFESIGTDFDRTSENADMQVGTEVAVVDGSEGLKKFRYVQFKDAVSSGNAKSVVGFSDKYGVEVTPNTSNYDQNKPMGVAVATSVTDEYYGWVQVYGYATVDTNGDGDISDGDYVILAGSTNGTVDSVDAGTASTYKPLGVAVAADTDADDTVEVFVTCG